jgi:hypothetical protein
MMVGAGETISGPGFTRRELLRTTFLTGVAAAAGFHPRVALAQPLARPAGLGVDVSAVFEPGVFEAGVF